VAVKEALSPSQIENAKIASRKFETAWRVYTHPRRHSLGEVEEAVNFLLEQKPNYVDIIMFPSFPAEAEVVDMVYAGMFHLGLTPPPEVKYKGRLN